jgi:hypothetical protein
MARSRKWLNERSDKQDPLIDHGGDQPAPVSLHLTGEVSSTLEGDHTVNSEYDGKHEYLWLPGLNVDSISAHES